MNKFLVSCIAVSGLFFTSCKDNKVNHANELNKESVEVDHLSGKTIVNKSPKNVVVIDFGIADSFEELGLPIKAMSKGIVPGYLNKLQKNEEIIDIGDIKTPNVEKINELEPGLIVISARQLPMYDELSKLAPTINLNIDERDYLNSFKKNQRVLGELFGVEDKVEKELKEIDKRIAVIHEKMIESDKKGLIILTNEGRMSSYGKGSRFGIIHDVFGIKEADPKIEVSTHGQSLSNELIQELNPDYLFVIDRGAAIKRNSLDKSNFINPLIAQTNAYKNNKIVFLSPDVWYLAGGGLKSIKIMINEIEAAINE